MGSIPDELLLARIRRESEAREAAFASLQAALNKSTAAFDEKLLVAASKLTTAVGSASALAGTAFRTAVDESSARAEQLTVLRAEFNNGLSQASASITETRVAFADATQAFAQQTLTLQTQFNASSAKFEEQITAISTNTSAIASRTTTLESQVQTPTTGLLARVSTVETTKVDASGAYAQANSAITASLTSTSAGTIGAAVQTEATARANADGFLSGKYSLKVTAGGIVTGMNITSSTGGGTDVSDITFQATSFKVYNGTTGVAPFQVVGGQVKVTGSLVISSGDVLGLGTLATQNSVTTGQVTGLGGLATKSSVDLSTSEVTNKSLANVDSTANTKLAGISANADVTLSAINGGLVITSGGLTLNGTPSIKSNNYSAGSAGWIIKGDGSVEFSSGTFRGSLAAGVEITTPKILGATLKFNGSSTICCDTSDGSDNSILRMNGGGADGVGRGGQIDVIGNEYSTVGGVAGAILITPGNAANGAVYIRDNTLVDRIKVDTSGSVVLNGNSATFIYNASFQTPVLTNITLKGSQLVFADTGGTARIDMQESWGIKLTRSSDKHHFHTSGTALVIGAVLSDTSLTGNRIYFGGSSVYLYESGGKLYLNDGNGDRALT
jgi:hypothetical protein